MHTRTCNIDSIRFAVLVRDHNNGMPARSTAAAAQHSISTPALVSMAGQWGAVLAAAADAPAAVLAATEANGSATALHSSVLRVDGAGYRCCCLQFQKTLDWINDLSTVIQPALLPQSVAGNQQHLQVGTTAAASG